MNAPNRATTYTLAGAVQAAAVAAFAVLLVYGVVTTDQAAGWLGLVGALVNLGGVLVHQLAARHVRQPVQVVVNNSAPQDPAAVAEKGPTP